MERDGPVPRVPGSLDIIPQDYVKERAFRTKVADRNVLCAQNTDAVASVTPLMLKNIWPESEYGLACLNGGAD
jgi:hypothetical protein